MLKPGTQESAQIRNLQQSEHTRVAAAGLLNEHYSENLPASPLPKGNCESNTID